MTGVRGAADDFGGANPGGGSDSGERYVQDPDGKIHVFPSDATDAEISAALATPPSTARGKPARSWTDVAMDVGKGVAKGAAHTVLDLGQAVSAIPGVGPALNAIGNAAGGVAGQAIYGTKANPAQAGPSFDQARQQTAYTNTPQRIGGALETAGELAVPVGEAAGALPSTVRAGQKFQQVMAAAKNVPVDVRAAGDAALRIQQLAERGGSMPMAVRKFLQYVTDPNKPALTYDAARDFASNLSRLSVDEFNRLTPVVQREVAQMSADLNRAVGDAAAKVGKGTDYRSAMQEYARAMRLRDTVDTFWQGLKRGLPYGGAIGAGSYLAKKLQDVLGDQK